MSLARRKSNDTEKRYMRTLAELALEDGNYQDVVVDGVVVVKGWRDCEDRWAIVSQYIKDNQSIVDIGSHFGYFSSHIAQNFPGSVVWSIEAGERRSEVQRMTLQENSTRNVLLSNYTLAQNDLVALVRSCETFDTILCLSTIHYFPPEQIPQILWLFGQIAPNLIIEFPSPKEIDVAEKQTVDMLDDPMRILGLAFDSVQKIGESTSPKDKSIKRSIYLAQNYEIHRDHCVSYLGAKTGRSHSVLFKDAHWEIDGKTVEHRGINLAHLKKFNLVFPKPEVLIRQATLEYLYLIEKNDGLVTDIHPRNVIVTSENSVPIDYSENIGKPIYGMSWEEYYKKVNSLDEVTLQELLTEKYNANSIAATFNLEGILE